MKFWQSLTWAETEQHCDVARFAEEPGFEGLIGAGTGWMREEFDLDGVDFSRRGRRMGEMIEVMQGLWNGEMFEYRGEFFDFDRIVVSPKPIHPIPLYFVRVASVALRRTARIGNGFIGAGHRPEDVPVVMEELARWRAEAGRSDLPFSFAFDGPSTLDQKKGLMEQFAEDVLSHFE